MKSRKILLLVAAVAVFLLAIPFWAEGTSGLIYIRYLAALVIAVPTIRYAIKKYKKTATRFYVLPCFSIILGFLVAGMFFSMKITEPNLSSQESYVSGFSDDMLNKEELQSNRSEYVHLTGGYDFFEEGFRLKNDTTLFQN